MPRISETTRLSRPDDVLDNQLGGEAVLLDLKTREYYGLDAVATSMWNAVTEVSTVRGAIDRLIADYDVSRPRLRRDLLCFVNDLADRGLLEPAIRRHR